MPDKVAAVVARKMLAMEKAATSRGPLIGLAKRSKAILEVEARKDMGGDTALSNWRRSKPVQVRIRDDITSERGDVVQKLRITPRPIGPMAVITHGRKAGVSSRRKSRGRRYGSTRGKGTWVRGRTRVEREGTRIMRQEKAKSVVSAFRS
jgi:hypothetical protein